MKVVPQATPQHTPQTTASNSAQDARARAIARLTSGAPTADLTAQPVPNATSISPEEMGAIHQGVKSDNNEQQATADSEVTETKAKEDPLSSQYATLARKEKALRDQVRQFKEAQAKFEQERQASLAPKQAEVDLSRYIERDRLKADPLSVFEDAGLSYDELTEAVLARQSMNTDPRIIRQLTAMQEELKAAREEIKASQEAQNNNQKQSYQQAVAQIKGEASKLIYTDPAFEMIKATNSLNDVVELIETTFKADGILMTVEEACQAVEDHLLEEAIKLTKVGKLQQRLSQSTAKPEVKDSKQPQQTTSKTLTNGMTAQRPISARERAIAAMEGKLKA